MSDGSPTIHSLTAGGIAAEHISLPAPEAFVAPTNSDKEHNTIKNALVPFACWRANDMRFDFESSFVRPEIDAELGALKELIDRHTLTDESGKGVHKPALTVFGHADPTGSDDFNKSLSGRRAQAIYALLVRKTDLWEELYSNPLGKDNWEPKAINAMQTVLGQSISNHPSSSARKSLFKSYMDLICTVKDEAGKPLKDEQGQIVRLELKPTDFLANGEDAQGKGDFQGCGEFNPVLMFSEAENKEFSEPKNTELRDGANAPNRRVLVFLFRPGIRIKPDAWPCPRAKEGVAACKKRFWSDAEQRRKFQQKRREFQDTQDTFACRFYDRLSNNSPCEKGPQTFQIRLYDPMGKVIANAPFELSIGLRKPIRGTANENGLVVAQDIEVPNRCILKWGFAPKDKKAPELIFGIEMFLTHDQLEQEDEAKQKLHNLGYSSENDFSRNVATFQKDYGKLAEGGLEESGKFGPRTMSLLRNVYLSCEKDLRNDKPQRKAPQAGG